MAASIIPELHSAPPLLSEALMAWQDRLDRIDPFFGDLSELQSLVSTAPCPEAAAWLNSQITLNRQFQASTFSIGEITV